MKMYHGESEALFHEYEEEDNDGIVAVCQWCTEDIYEGEEYYLSPVWDGEREICADCILYTCALKDLFEEMDVWSKVECLGINKIYADEEGF